MYFCRLKYFSFNKSQSMKRILLVCAVLLVVLPSCFRKIDKTHHHIETDGYTLTVSGQRIFSDDQLAAIPKDTGSTFGDTVTLHNDVTWVALQMEMLSEDCYMYSDSVHFRGEYILDLELIHHPGSDHAANASAALANLRDWGYITIDTTDWQKVIIVREGTCLKDYTIKSTSSYDYSPYEIYVPDELASDSIDNVALDQYMFGLMDWPLSHPDELFQFLTTHGYDTINAGFSHRQIYPHATRSYENSITIYEGSKTAAKSKKAARNIIKKIRSL